MDGTKKLSKFIVDWERLHTIMALIGAGKCINFAQLCLRNG